MVLRMLGSILGSWRGSDRIFNKKKLTGGGLMYNIDGDGWGLFEAFCPFCDDKLSRKEQWLCCVPGVIVFIILMLCDYFWG